MLYSCNHMATTVQGIKGLNNHFIANFPQNMPVKKFENRLISGDDMDNSLRLTFRLWTTKCSFEWTDV